jgi:hypothetical protein
MNALEKKRKLQCMKLAICAKGRFGAGVGEGRKYRRLHDLKLSRSCKCTAGSARREANKHRAGEAEKSAARGELAEVRRKQEKS